MRRCPGPALCPFASGRRYFVLLGLVALLVLCMTTVAVCACIMGKDGVITGTCCAAMSTAVCGVLVGGVRIHSKSDKEE
jgi:hypothetical protein